MGGGSALRIGWNPMPSVTILDSLKGCLFLWGKMEYKSFLKTVGGGEGEKCRYPTRLDTYGCGCEHNCAYCYARSLLDFRGLWGKPRVADIERVRRAVRRLKRGSIVRMGGMTDCFAPIERRKGVTDENNVILSGHTRRLALLKMGYEESDVIRVTGLTDLQKRKYRILANKTNEFAGWDFDKLEMELDGLDFEGFDFGLDLETVEEEKGERKEATYIENVTVVIDCDNDEEAERIFNELTEEGYQCRISTL